MCGRLRAQLLKSHCKRVRFAAKNHLRRAVIVSDGFEFWRTITDGGLSMPESLFSPEVQSVLTAAKDTGGPPKAFPSPIDWRDQWIYFLMVDRFNNSAAGPHHQPFDDPNFFGFQGGNFSGIEDQLPYIKNL